MAEMQRAGIGWPDIIDHYIPEAARKLGEAWCEDELSFADVSIGTARLQAMLHELAPEWPDAVAPGLDAPDLLLIVMSDCHHTLGAMVAAAQLRRKGCSVRISLGQSRADLIGVLRNGRFDAIMISASSAECLEKVQNLVKNIRRTVLRCPPIILGGTLLEVEPEAEMLSGVDHATSDPGRVLDLCEWAPRNQSRAYG